MARRQGRREADPDAPVVDLDRVLADDLRIDLISRQPWPDRVRTPRSPGAHRATGRHHRPAADEPLFELLDEWRLELAGAPLPPLVVGRPSSPSRASRTRHRKRSWRPVMAVAAAIGAVLVGSATVGAADADPGSPLWPITQIIWPAHAQSIESAEQIRVALDEARVALEAGRGGDARRAIIRAVGELGNIDDAAAQDSIRTTVNQLWSRSAPSVVSGITPGGVVPAGGSAVSGPPGTAGPTARTDQVVADVTGPIPAGPVGTVNATRLVPGGSSGSPVDVTPSGSTLPPPPSAAGSAAPESATAPSAGPAPSTDPAAPATVPDPAEVVEPSASASATSSPAVATQQSGPAPTRTTESSSDAGSPAARGVSGADDVGDQSPAAADQAQTSSSPDPTTTGGPSSG